MKKNEIEHRASLAGVSAGEINAEDRVHYANWELGRSVGDFRMVPEVAFRLVKVFGTGMLSGRIVLGVASLPLGMPLK